MAIDTEVKKQLEGMGPDVVRVRLEKFQGDTYRQAIEWLSEKDRERETSARQVANSAKIAAWIAAIASIIAAAAAILSIIVELKH